MRLIDADELKTVKSIQSADFNSIETIQMWIDSAPTVKPPTRCIAEIHIDADEVVERIKNDYCMPFEWIPVTERLPEEAFGCLVTVWDTDPVTMEEFENLLPYFVGWDGEQWNDGEGEQCPFEVIAWMPLPEPWKGADDESD